MAQQVWKLLNGGPRARSNSSTFSLRLRPIPTGWLAYPLRFGRRSHARDARSALGGYPINRFSPRERTAVVDGLIRLVRSLPHSGLHSSISWLLRNQWGLGQELSHVEAELAPRIAMQRGPGRHRCELVRERADANPGRNPGAGGVLDGSPVDELGRVRGPKIAFHCGSRGHSPSRRTK